MGAGWPPNDVHGDGVWYITLAQEQTFADSREDEPAELPCLGRGCNCYAVWAVPDAPRFVGVHAPKHGSDCWESLTWALPFGKNAFKNGHLDIKHFGSLDEALRGYYDGTSRHELFGPARLFLW